MNKLLPVKYRLAVARAVNRQVVATSLAEPLERHLGQIADVAEMTSQSQTGQARVILRQGCQQQRMTQ